MNITHDIVRVERGETSNSKSPMWRCTTSDGQRVNVFQHTDPVKNSFRHFDAAGYGPALIAMSYGEISTWKNHPIGVQFVKAGQWWDIVTVAPIQADAVPDPKFAPDSDLYALAAKTLARNLTFLTDPEAICWDTETTGLTDDDEIVELSAVNFTGQVVFSSLIKPHNPDRLLIPQADGRTAADITGIAPDMLLNAPTFEEAYPKIERALRGNLWVIYNAPYDTRMLELACSRAGLMPILPVGTTCAMQLFAMWNGEWDASRQRWVVKKLSEACEIAGIKPTEAHRALADALSTFHLMDALTMLPTKANLDV